MYMYMYLYLKVPVLWYRDIQDLSMDEALTSQADQNPPVSPISVSRVPLD